MRNCILLICGTINQTKMMEKIGRELSQQANCWFTPFYGDGWLDLLARYGLLDFTAMAGPLRRKTLRYLRQANLAIDDGGSSREYDLVITCTDLYIQKNIEDKPIILVQEGLMEQENLQLGLVRSIGLPRYLANTAATGLSHSYDVFCVASNGYRDWFIDRGVDPTKLAVTGIPNFDHAHHYLDNDFPHHDFALVATSNARETYKFDNRAAFLERAFELAGDQEIIFKLHPAEDHQRASDEIKLMDPEALILTEGDIHPMIANCNMLIAQYSSVVFTAYALGKPVHSYLDDTELAQLAPIQNAGTSAAAIAEIAGQMLAGKALRVPATRTRSIFNTLDLELGRLLGIS